MNLRLMSIIMFCAVTVPTGLLAQNDPGPLVTDRPDQTESAVTVGPGLFQLEAGWLFTNATLGQGEDIESHTVAPALLRIGVLDALEARVGFQGWTRTRTSSGQAATTESGFGSLDLGFKYKFTDEDGMRPGIALLGAVTLPVGSPAIRAKRVDPAVRVAIAHSLSERVSLGYNLGVATVSVEESDDVTTLAAGIYTVVFGFAVSNRIGAFAEAFGALGLSSDAGSSHLLDGGFTFLMVDNLQLDASAGVRYAGDAEDAFVSAGVSWRIPR